MTRAAFVLGSNGPETLGRLKRLTYAESDADRIAEAFSVWYVGFSVIRPRGRDAPSIINDLTTLVTSLTRQDDFLFYFSGHGIVSHGELYLVLDNSKKGAWLTNTALPWRSIKNIVQHADSINSVVILDCCHAGQAVGDLLGETLKGGFQSGVIDATIRGSTAYVLIACGPDAVARETRIRGGGILTSLILDGIGPKRKEAASEASGQVSLESLRDWMWKEIDSANDLKMLRGDERPRLYVSGGPTFYITLNAKPAGGDPQYIDLQGENRNVVYSVVEFISIHKFVIISVLCVSIPIFILYIFMSLSDQTTKEPPIYEPATGEIRNNVANEAYVYKYWRGKGLYDFQAAAAVGAFKVESNLNPSAIGGFYGKAFGLAQWLGKRRDALFEYAKAQGVDLESAKTPTFARIKTEMDFTWEEMQNSEHPSMIALRSSATLEEAERAFSSYIREPGYQEGRLGHVGRLYQRASEDALAKARAGVYK